MISNPQGLWAAAQDHLRLNVSENTYKTWLQDATFVEFKSGVFYIGAPNAYIKDWLEQRLYRQVYRALNSVAPTYVDVQFILNPEARNIPMEPLIQPPTVDLDIALQKLMAKSGMDAPEPKKGKGTKTTQHAPVVAVEPTMFFAQGETINPDYTLKNFQVGQGNELAHRAASAIVQAKTQTYNPLFITGGTGLGKTHLLHAIGNAFQQAGLKVLLISGETFTNDLVRAIRQHQNEAFRQFYRSPQVLIVDDVAFMAGKDSTQQEFLHTFNSLHNHNCQIILAADRKPHEIIGLDEKLVSRFSSGLVADLQMPAEATRMAILKAKATAQDIELPTEIADLIATRVRDSIRRLEGALNHVLAHIALTRKPLTVQLAHTLLKDYLGNSKSRELDLHDVLEATARYHQLTLDDLLSKQRNQEISRARHLAIYLAREELKISLPIIGRIMGGRSHSTIVNSCQKVEELLEKDAAFRNDYTRLRQEIHAGLS